MALIEKKPRQLFGWQNMKIKSVIVKILLLMTMIPLCYTSIVVLAGDTDRANTQGKDFAHNLNNTKVKDAAKTIDPATVPHYQDRDVPETSYYESGTNIENQARTEAASNPTAQFINNARKERPQITIDKETDPLFTRYEDIANQAHDLTGTYSDCKALPVGAENNVTTDERLTASCEPGVTYVDRNISCLCKRAVINSQPLTPDCPADHHYDDGTKKCVLSTIETRDPNLVCDPSYHLNSADQCEHSEDLVEAVTVVCPDKHTYVASTKQCVTQVLDTKQPSLACESGYRYVSTSNRCEKKKTTTKAVMPTCPPRYTYDTHYNRCQKSVVKTANATATCPRGKSLIGDRCGKAVKNCRTDTRAARECKGTYPHRYTKYRVWYSERFGGKYFFQWGNSMLEYIKFNHSSDEFTKDNYLYYAGDFIHKLRYVGKGYEICRCATNQIVNYSSPISFCPVGYSYNKTSKQCEKVGVVTQTPGRSCPANYKLNASAHLCERKNVLVESPDLVCDPPYALNAANNKCEYTRSVNELPEFVCPIGYTLVGESCQLTVVTKTPPKPVCESNETLNATRSSCERMVVVIAQPSYGCQQGYVLNPSNNLCEEAQFSFSCETTNPARTVDLCAETLSCPDGDCAEEYQVQQDASEDFKRAATGMAVASEIVKEIDQDNLSVFKGDSKACKKKLASFSDCCKDSGWGTDLGLDNCSSEEKELGLLRKAKLVHYVGRYCSDDSILGCLAKHDVYCSYPSKLARIIIQQGKSQLGQGFGSAEDPNCQGFSVEELESLDFDAMDLSEFYADVENNANNASTPNATDLKDDIQDRLKARYPDLDKGDN